MKRSNIGCLLINCFGGIPRTLKFKFSASANPELSKVPSVVTPELSKVLSVVNPKLSKPNSLCPEFQHY